MFSFTRYDAGWLVGVGMMVLIGDFGAGPEEVCGRPIILPLI